MTSTNPASYERSIPPGFKGYDYLDDPKKDAAQDEYAMSIPTSAEDRGSLRRYSTDLTGVRSHLNDFNELPGRFKFLSTLHTEAYQVVSPYSGSLHTSTTRTSEADTAVDESAPTPRRPRLSSLFVANRATLPSPDVSLRTVASGVQGDDFGISPWAFEHLPNPVIFPHLQIPSSETLVPDTENRASLPLNSMPDILTSTSVNGTNGVGLLESSDGATIANEVEAVPSPSSPYELPSNNPSEFANTFLCNINEGDGADALLAIYVEPNTP
ncbi:hypothetical protein BU26DRAFT_565919 [Trematosphaeria pertusa]|uniref:Uncharacterized protein n=1 Tax=Trematosphaeria pertusa TaxID=390896 RepID=A0A6A6IF54_9PLEO|nr:uncharacterized protein BU26DRAFT_565919 [Trematosphaeria pertusa]KAF2248532.1 hypothetical protein BU26DRAFT_565919 [Trematosphaeria pertusa]